MSVGRWLVSAKGLWEGGRLVLIEWHDDRGARLALLDVVVQ